MHIKNAINNIRAYLPKEYLDAKTLSIKIFHFLSSLTEINSDLFSDWYEQGRTKKEAQKRKVIFDKEYLENIITKEWDKKFPELGSNFSFWSGKDNESENVQLNFNIGKTTINNNLNNLIGISLPQKQSFVIEKDDKLIKDIIALMKSIWNPLKIEID